MIDLYFGYRLVKFLIRSDAYCMISSSQERQKRKNVVGGVEISYC